MHLYWRSGRSVSMVLLASDETERGEWLPRPPLGEGERERVSYWRATCRGVEGTELECCETIDGRCMRANWGCVCVWICVCEPVLVVLLVPVLVPASRCLLGPVLFALEPLPLGGVIVVGALDCTLHCLPLCPSAELLGATGLVCVEGVGVGAARVGSRWGGGLSEWGDTMTAGNGSDSDSEAGGWCTSSMRASCRYGWSRMKGAWG